MEKVDHLHLRPHDEEVVPGRNRSLHYHLSSNLLSKPIAYIILLILTYALGYFSSLSSTPNPKPSFLNTQLTVSTPPNCPDTAAHNIFGPPCADPLSADRVRQKILDRVFNGTSPYADFPPPHVAGLLRSNRIKGWGSYGAVFKNLVSRVRPSTIIEAGTFLGASAIHMAQLTRELGLETQILCVDDYRGWPGFRDKFNYAPMINGDVLLLYQFLQNVVHFNVTGSIIPVPFSTGSVLEKLCEWGVVADLIEVDAGHDFHSAWADINRAHKLLRRPGGVLFGHDYFTAYDNRGVRRAVDLFARVHGFRVKVDGEHWVLDSP